MDEAKAVVHVVEDDDSVRTAVVRLLRTAGFQAQPYASAAEFLLVAGENAGGCMVLDVGLPGMSGPDLQLELARRGHAIPIVFITAQSDASLRPRLLARGAVACLFKPFSHTGLLDALKVALG